LAPLVDEPGGRLREPGPGDGLACLVARPLRSAVSDGIAGADVQRLAERLGRTSTRMTASSAHATHPSAVLFVEIPKPLPTSFAREALFRRQVVPRDQRRTSGSSRTR